ncbi:unnamed protein product [Mucor hiemalis]
MKPKSYANVSKTWKQCCYNISALFLKHLLSTLISLLAQLQSSYNHTMGFTEFFPMHATISFDHLCPKPNVAVFSAVALPTTIESIALHLSSAVFRSAISLVVLIIKWLTFSTAYLESLAQLISWHTISLKVRLLPLRMQGNSFVRFIVSSLTLLPTLLNSVATAFAKMLVCLQFNLIRDLMRMIMTTSWTLLAFWNKLNLPKHCKMPNLRAVFPERKRVNAIIAVVAKLLILTPRTHEDSQMIKFIYLVQPLPDLQHLQLLVLRLLPLITLGVFRDAKHSTCWRTSSILPRRMGKDHKQQVDSGRYSKRVPHPLHHDSTSLSYHYHPPISNSTYNASENSDRVGNSISVRETSNRENPWSRFPLPSLHSPQENRRLASSSKLKTSKSTYTEKAIQDGNHTTRVQNDSTSRLSYFYRPAGCISACLDSLSISEIPPISMEEEHLPVQNSSFRTVTEPHGIHQDIEASPTLGTQEGNSDFGLFGRSHHRCEKQGTQPSSHFAGMSEIERIGFPLQRIQISPSTDTTDQSPRFHHRHQKHVTFSADIETSRHTPGGTQNVTSKDLYTSSTIVLHRQGTSDYPSCVSGQIANSRSPPIEEPSLAERSAVERHCSINTISVCQPTLVDQPLDEMEWAIISSRNTDTGNLHRCVGPGMGYHLQQSRNERDLDPGGVEPAYQLSRASSDMEMCELESFTGSSAPHLLRQHISHSLHSPLWGDALTSSDGTSIIHLERMPEEKHPLTSDVHPISNQPSGLAVSTDDHPDRMEDRSTIFSSLRTIVGDTRHRLLCQLPESSDSTLLQLEMGPEGTFNECFSDPMESLEESIHLPTMEPSSSMPSAYQPVPNCSDDHNAELAISNMVSSPVVDDATATDTSPTVDDSPQSSRRRSLTEEPELGTSGMERKRQRLELRGFDDNALAILLNPEAQPSIKRYDPIQQQFMRWCELHRFNAYNPDPIQIVNYLAYGHHTLSWKTSTCLSYKSAILDLYEQSDRDRIQSDEGFHKFFSNLRALTVRSYDKADYDISPVITKIRSWGSNELLDVEKLTQKLCFLLAITGFLRYADLHRINLDKTRILPSGQQLKLVIDCPKEKRRGSPIERVVFINNHPDSHLCPVQTFQAYTVRIATSPCIGPHPTRPSRTINYLIRSLNNSDSRVSVQTISRHVRSLLSLIAINGISTVALKARAVGSSNAVLHGARVEDILVHGSWASSKVFDDFYRLSRQTMTNFTTMALSSNSMANTLDPQSESPTQDH